MKYIQLFSIFLCSLLFSCQKETSPVFDKSPDQRITEALDHYQQLLVAAPHGWKAFLYPAGVDVDSSDIGGFTFYFQFLENNRVVMLSDFDQQTSTTPRESSCRLKALQQPTLIFDTYSYIHTIADPNPNVSYGWYGRGWASDFELAFTEQRQDTILLTGRFNKSRVVMVRATEMEKAAFLDGRLHEIVGNTITYAADHDFLFLEGSNNSRIGVDFDYNYLVVRFTYLDDAGQVQTVNAPFSHTLQGLQFKYPVYVGGYTFREMFWDDERKLYYFLHHFLAGMQRIDLQNAPEPIIPLWKVWGVKYSTLTIPVAPLEGQSALFASRYAAVKMGVKTGGYNLDLGDMSFVFNAPARTMTISAVMRQGASPFTFTWNYSYAVDGAGLFRFTRTGQNANAALVEANMRPLLNSIETEGFLLRYFVSGTTTLGQFTSAETPEFFFTGTLR